MAMNKNHKDVTYVANLLDSAFKLPNGWRIGWDGILGLIPGVGNIVTDCFSFYILFRAAQIGVAPSVLAHMGLNVVIDNLVDKVPGLGFIFDFMWKSNTKNVELLERYMQEPAALKKRSSRTLMLTFILLAIFFVACLSASIFAAIWLIKELVNYFQAY